MYNVLKDIIGLGLICFLTISNVSIRKKCDILESALQEKQAFFENVNKLNANYTADFVETIRAGREALSNAKMLANSSKENKDWYNTKLPYSVVQLLTTRVSD